MLGGSSEAAARRAARIADGFLPSTPDVWSYYVDECRSLGKLDPGPCLGGDTTSFHLARDVEQGWREFGPYALHEMNAYWRWMEDSGARGASGYALTPDLDALRASGHYRVVTPDERGAIVALKEARECLELRARIAAELRGIDGEGGLMTFAELAKGAKERLAAKLRDACSIRVEYVEPGDSIGAPDERFDDRRD